MEIKFKDGLIFTSIELSFRGSSEVIENVVIDTGVAETIISPDVVEGIGIIAEENDNVNSFYGVGGSLHNFFSKGGRNLYRTSQVRKNEIRFWCNRPERLY